jgi:hypothetical protein
MWVMLGGSRGSMTEQLNVQSSPVSRPNQPEFADDFADASSFDTSAFQRLDLAGSELATQAPTCVRLDLEDLACFEIVDHQFERWGVTFSNAIALHPSNPAYPPRSGTTVLMGSPKSGWVEATFRRPVRFVSSYVTSSRRTVLAAFDANNQPITQTELPHANLAGSGSTTPPNKQLTLRGDNIHRVTFYAFDGQLTLDEFSFSF